MNQFQQKNCRQVGSVYEHIAGAYLEEKGYEILEYNWHCRRGEIDLIARDQGYLVFVEVKYRSDLSAGHPLEAVHTNKQRVISKCAAVYLTQHGLMDVDCRFDVVGILGEEDREIIHVEDAFPYI